MSSFTMTTHQIWSRHMTLAPNLENFYFSPNTVLNFRKIFQIWGKLAQEQNVTGKKQSSGWKLIGFLAIRQCQSIVGMFMQKPLSMS